MANPTVYPSNLQWVGLGKETTYGTPAAAPTIWVPVMDPKWTPQQTMLKDQGLRGNMAKTQGQVQGVRYDEITYKFNLFLDSVYPHFLNILGNPDTISGTAAPYTHKTALLNTSPAQPSSWTVFLFNGAETWQMPGCQQSQVDIDIKAESLAELTTTWMGQPATKIANPTNTPTTNRPAASWNSTITVGGTQTSAYSEAKVTFKRSTAPIHTADGTQAPYLIFCGELEVTGELTAVYQGYTGAPTDLSNYLANTQPTLSVQVNPVGDTTHFLLLQHSVVGYDSVEVSGSAGKWMEAAAKFEALANATDALGGGVSPAQVQVVNTAATAY